MRQPLRRFPFATLLRHSSLGRMWENFGDLLTPTTFSPTSANGAPIHLLKFDRSKRAERAQTISVVAHGCVIAVLLALASYPPNLKRDSPLIRISTDRDRLHYVAPKSEFVGEPSLGRHAGGGENSPVPPTRGFFPPRSSVQLAPPRLPDHADHLLPVTATILDPQAPTIVWPQDPGLPAMTITNASAGPGADGGIGRGKDGGVGDRGGPGAGEGDFGRNYANGISLPTCVTCPYPVYTDEARHVKMQGTVTLRVLVEVDGKAGDIRVIRGVGYGLDERAVQTVRGWKFNPARDVNHRAVAAWVTVEAVFRLF